MEVPCIIFDWKRTLYDPDSKLLIEGSVPLLEYLYVNSIPLVLIGKGGSEMEEELERLHVRKYFQNFLFVEGQKDPSLFSRYIDAEHPEHTVVVGDRVRSEIEIGNKLGCQTIWVKQGKFENELPENANQKPTYTLDSLGDLKEFFAKILFHN